MKTYNIVSVRLDAEKFASIDMVMKKYKCDSLSALIKKVLENELKDIEVTKEPKQRSLIEQVDEMVANGDTRDKGIIMLELVNAL